MEPKISIIIPVYNVEKYLAECLDSVINQTLREIQIICVNDGSPDSSRTILQKYADRDPRIEIIDKPNGGASSARNAAVPYIRGKYVLNIDSDDWVEHDLCAKTFQKAEETNADMVYFFLVPYRPGALVQDWNAEQMRIINSEVKTTVEEKKLVLAHNSACNKLFRTDFFVENKIMYPEELIFGEDIFVNWKAVILAQRIVVLHDRLYHYRYNVGSVTQSTGEHLLHPVLVFNKIRDFLFETGNYSNYRDKYMSKRYTIFFYQYLKMSASLREKFVSMIRDSLADDDREFFSTANKRQFESPILSFFAMLNGGQVDALKFRVALFAYHAMPYIARIPGVRFTVRRIVRPMLKRMVI